MQGKHPMRVAGLAVLTLAPWLLLTACGGGSAESAEPQMAAPPEPPPPPPPPPAPPLPADEPSAEVQPAPPPRTVSVSIVPRSKSKLSGTVTLTEVEDGVKVSIQVANVKAGDHGIHIHEKADCSAPDAKSAGDHFSPKQNPHGMPDSDQKHLGDLGNLTVDKDGTGTAEVTVKGANLKEDDPQSFIGRALVVHEKKDDGKSQPAGNAGSRIGCAELKLVGSAEGAQPEVAKPGEAATQPGAADAKPATK